MIVVDEDFEDGVADSFLELSGNWGIIDDETNTNKILETRGSTDDRWANIGFVATNLSNCAIEFRVRLVNYESIPDGGKTSISFRGQWGKGNFGLDLQPYWNDMSLRYEGDFGSNVWTRLDQVNFSITKNNWYLIRLEIVQDRMTVYLDGKNVLSAHDDRLAPIFRFTFNVDNNAQVQFDDVRLWALPSLP